jgi:2-methylisocitrate lyase-like PEP mutase family enzyme
MVNEMDTKVQRPSVSDKRRAFRALHQQGCFVLPNPWDVGSARMLQHLGFLGLASTSTGFAWAAGRPDYAVHRTEVLRHLTTLCRAVDIPVNADFENGFALDPEGVAVSVRLALDAGVAGLSIEDRNLDGSPDELYDVPEAVKRVQAAREAIDSSGTDVVLVARTEILLIDSSAIGTAIDKLAAFAEAGADCLYAPGVQKREDIAALARAVSPKPLNVVMSAPGLTVAELADLGVRRISIGGALARVAWAAAIGAAEKIKGGSFDGLAGGTPGARLNGMFGQFD